MRLKNQCSFVFPEGHNCVRDKEHPGRCLSGYERLDTLGRDSLEVLVGALQIRRLEIETILLQVREEIARWVARVKLLETRAEAAIRMLRGDVPPSNADTRAESPVPVSLDASAKEKVPSAQADTEAPTAVAVSLDEWANWGLRGTELVQSYDKPA
jgi:hypothetical protein